jgi:hypothetical protein
VALKKTSIYLDDELDRVLARRAAEEGVSKAEFIRRGLEGLATRPKRVKPTPGTFSGPAQLAGRDEDHLLTVDQGAR